MKGKKRKYTGKKMTLLIAAYKNVLYINKSVCVCKNSKVSEKSNPYFKKNLNILGHTHT